jgi:hypothetical protein
MISWNNINNNISMPIQSLRAEGAVQSLRARSEGAVQPIQEQPQSFIESKTFQGSNPGYVFTTREQGTGYYLDNKV